MRSGDAISEFLREFYHDDHGAQRHNTRVVLFNSCAETPHLRLARTKNQFARQIWYLEGSPLDPTDLQRCRLEEASAFFMLTDKQGGNSVQKDRDTVLQVIVLRKIASILPRSPSLRELDIYVQLYNTESMFLLQALGLTDHQVLGIEEIKLGLIAKSCMAPAFSTMILNLFISEQKGGRSKATRSMQWFEEYTHGMCMEIYSVPMSPAFNGMAFSEVAATIFRDYNAIMIGLLVHGQGVVINPRDYKIRSAVAKTADRAFVITNEEFSARLIAQRASKDDFQKRTKKRSARRGTLFGSAITRGSMENTSVSIVLDDDDRLTLRKQLYGPDDGQKVTGWRAGGRGDLPLDEVKDVARKKTMGNVRKELGGVLSDLDKVLGGPEGRRASVVDAAKKKAPRTVSDPEIENAMLASWQTMTSNWLSMAGRFTDFDMQSLFAFMLPPEEMLRGHIVVCGLPSDLRQFVMPLRGKFWKTVRPIIFVSPSVPPMQQWQGIASEAYVYFIKGEPTEISVLRRAGIMSAHSVAILAMQGASTEHADAYMVDSQAILTYHLVQSKVPARCHVLTELHFSSNTKFLQERHRGKKEVRRKSVFQGMTQSSADNVKGSVSMAGGEQLEVMNFNSPQFAGGRVYSSAILDTVAAQANYKPDLFAVLRRVCSQETGVVMFPVPHHFNGKSFGEVFEFLARTEEVIALGVLRTKDGMKYPFTCPAADHHSSILTTHDSIIVLTHDTLAKTVIASQMGTGAKTTPPSEMRVVLESKEEAPSPVPVVPTPAPMEAVAVEEEAPPLAVSAAEEETMPLVRATSMDKKED
jgi:hypothetical protein